MNSVDRMIKRVTERNKIRPLKTEAEVRQNSKDRNREYVARYLQSHPCVQCGETNILRLEFDHIDPSTKEKAIGQMMCGGLEKIKTEIAKCQILCASCHSEKTLRENNSWRLKYQD